MKLIDTLNKKIINISGSAVGLEINDLSIRVVQVEKQGKNDNIIGYGSTSDPSGGMIDGEILETESIVAAIKKVINGAKPRKINAKKVVCSISETKAFLRIINIPKMKKEEVKEAIRWEIEANIPMSIDQVYYDWQILDRNFSNEEDKMSILMMAVPRNIVERLLETVESIGLEVIDVEIESIAQARSLLDEKENDSTTMIVDIGGRRTSFLISFDNIPCFTSSIPISARTMTDAISKSLNITIEEAERKKMEIGIGSVEKNDPVFRAVGPVLENLVSEIEKSIDFYLTGLRYSDSIDKIVVCGGGANTKGLIPYLTKRLDREIELGDPWINFNMKDKEAIIKKNDSVQYSTAIGLALKGLRYENIS